MSTLFELEARIRRGDSSAVADFQRCLAQAVVRREIRSVLAGQSDDTDPPATVDPFQTGPPILELLVQRTFERLKSPADSRGRQAQHDTAVLQTASPTVVWSEAASLES